jgi:CheY-like chemotaxis protein/signal transduction histidine kinase
VGQAAFEKQRILLTNVPSDYVQITSGLGQGTPLNIIVLPVLFEGRVKAVIELASFELFSAAHQSFLDQLTESLAIVLNTIEAGARTEALLKESQTLAGRLQSQQEELQQSNEELEEKARLLSAQNAEVERKNREINVARLALVEKAEQLALTSKYKSEFLANMSHELRTPLNSLLILAQQLEHNKDGNLTETQVKFAHTIHGAGTDLLHLINDILDLSKIESGTVTPEVAEVQSRSFREDAERLFAPVAAEKGLAFVIDLDPVLPRTITTDGRRVQQVIKNLLSNALKFTPKGSVELSIRLVQAGWSSDHEVLQHADRVIAFSVKDTGIGIAPENQKTIFEAFQQADGSTTRKYGGTGLGLAISREIAYLLGGELCVHSTLGEGSTFTLYLPQVYAGPHKPFGRAAPISAVLAARKESVAPMVTAEPPPLGTVEDDRREIGFGDRVLLVVEDDPKFATVVADMARGRGFKVLISQRGEQAVALVREFKPAAVILDLLLPDVGGWTVLDRIKFDPATRHIPVHVMTVADEDSRRALDHGAFAFLKKPVSHEELTEALARIEAITGAGRVARLLLAEDNEAEATAIREMIGAEDVDITTVRSGEAALAAVKTGSYDCVVLDLRLPDISGQRVLELLRAEPALRELPVIVYTAAEPDGSEQDRLKSLAQSVIVKGGRSSERLLAETALFLHRVTADLPEEKRKVIEAVHQSDTALAGRKVLLVDDDTRNLYALTAVLEAHGMSVIVADNGRQALQRLQAENGVDIVLMDMMMPEMDGYAAMRAIRRMPERAALPILALTAKAMKGDREKCLQAGASDYISKPIHTDQLLSLMRVWLYR